MSSTFLDRRDLIALRIDHPLPKAVRVDRGPGTDHVNNRLVAGLVEAAPEHFAVDHNHLAVGRFVERLDPAQQASLEIGRRQHRGLLRRRLGQRHGGVTW